MVLIEAVYLTLALVLAAFCLLGGYLRQRYPEHRHLVWMICGIATMSSTMAVGAFAPDTTGKMVVMAAMFFASAALTSQTFTVLTDAKRGRPATLLLATILTGITIAATLVGTSYIDSGMPMYLACSLLLGEAGWLVWCQKTQSSVDRALALCLSAMAVIFTLRGIGYFIFFNRQTTFSILKTSPYEIGTMLAMAVPGITLTMLMFFRTLDDTANYFREVSQTDALTGLLNRGAFLSTAGKITDGSFLIICDIDHFKCVNDTWGHATGDMALVSLGSLFRGINMTAARIGGEEFAMFIHRASAEQARLAAEGLRTAFSLQEIEGLPAAERLTASFGISAFQHGDTFDALFKRADAALYKAKAMGRDRVVMCDFTHTNKATTAA